MFHDLAKANALIRKHFGIDPNTLEDDEWAKQAAEAIWLQQFEAELIANEMAKVIVKLFGKK